MGNCWGFWGWATAIFFVSAMGYGREFVGRKGWRVEGVRAVSGSFALERRAQDDIFVHTPEENRQRQRRIRRFWLRQNDGAAGGMTVRRGEWQTREQATAKAKAKCGDSSLRSEWQLQGCCAQNDDTFCITVTVKVG